MLFIVYSKHSGLCTEALTTSNKPLEKLLSSANHVRPATGHIQNDWSEQITPKSKVEREFLLIREEGYISSLSICFCLPFHLLCTNKEVAREWGGWKSKWSLSCDLVCGPGWWCSLKLAHFRISYSRSGGMAWEFVFLTCFQADTDAVLHIFKTFILYWGIATNNIAIVSGG